MIGSTAKRCYIAMDLSRVQSLLDYCPETGIFKWKVNRGTGRAGATLKPNAEGYIKVTIDGKRYQCHNIAWLLVYGEWPSGLVDHKNCNTRDNRIENLRMTDRQGNAANARKRKDNTSGVKGVSWKASHQRWVAQCSFKGVVHYLGLYDSIKEAEIVVKAFRRKVHGEFANDGI